MANISTSPFWTCFFSKTNPPNISIKLAYTNFFYRKPKLFPCHMDMWFSTMSQVKFLACRHTFLEMMVPLLSILLLSNCNMLINWSLIRSIPHCSTLLFHKWSVVRPPMKIGRCWRCCMIDILWILANRWKVTYIPHQWYCFNGKKKKLYWAKSMGPSLCSTRKSMDDDFISLRRLGPSLMHGQDRGTLCLGVSLSPLIESKILIPTNRKIMWELR